MSYDDLQPGALIPANDDPVEINAGLRRSVVWVTNTGQMPVHLTAHYHVFEANKALKFDRRKAYGMRPDVPAGGAIRIEPGDTEEVPLVPIGGNRVVRGFHGLVDGPLDDGDPDIVLQRAIELGFQHQPEE